MAWQEATANAYPFAHPLDLPCPQTGDLVEMYGTDNLSPETFVGYKIDNKVGPAVPLDLCSIGNPRP